jgi:chromosome segregation ATPase
MSTKTGGEDEGLAKLRALVAALTRTNEAMEQHNETLDSESNTLAELEDTVEEKVDDVEEKLEKARADIETAHDDAVEEIDDVVAAARAGVDDTLADAVKDIDRAETRFIDAAQDAGDELDQDHGDLRDQGFVGLAADLDVVEQVLKQAATEMDGSGDSFEGAVQADGTEVARELGEAEAKVETAAASTQNEQKEIETQAGSEGESFGDMGTAFDSAVDTLFDGIETGYDSLDDEVEDAAKSFVDMVRAAVKAEATEIEAEIGTEIQQPTAAVLDPAAVTYLAHVVVAEAAVGAVIETGEAMEKTVDNLMVCKDVCDTIRETLAAME